MSETLLCPRCAIHHYTPYGGVSPTEEAPRPAMSRAADVHICSWCGMHEAFMNLAGAQLPGLSEWPLAEEQIARAKERLPA